MYFGCTCVLHSPAGRLITFALHPTNRAMQCKYYPTRLGVFLYTSTPRGDFVLVRCGNIVLCNFLTLFCKVFCELMNIYEYICFVTINKYLHEKWRVYLCTGMYTD